jgi:cyanate permease
VRLPVPRRRDSRAPRVPGDQDGKQTLTRRPVLLALAITLVAANLRPALASVGPVLDDVRIDLALTGTLAALLVSLPVLCLGALAPAAPRLARRWGMEPIIAMVLGAIAAGLLLRVVGGTGLLFVGTVIASGAIAVANVLLPALIKRDFPAHSGAMMGVYTMALSGFAAVAGVAGYTSAQQRTFGCGGGRHESTSQRPQCVPRRAADGLLVRHERRSGRWRLIAHLTSDQPAFVAC